MPERKGWQLAVCLVILGMNLAAQTASPPNSPNPDLTALQNQLNALRADSTGLTPLTKYASADRLSRYL